MNKAPSEALINAARALVTGSVTLGLVACLPPKPTQLGPATASSSKTPMAAAQAVAQLLIADGFDLTVSDASSGIVTAQRVRAKAGNNDLVSCYFRAGSPAANGVETAFTINFSATAGPTGTVVVVRSRVRTAYPGLTGALAMAPNDEDCASNGVEEAKILATVK